MVRKSSCCYGGVFWYRFSNGKGSSPQWYGRCWFGKKIRKNAGNTYNLVPEHLPKYYSIQSVSKKQNFKLDVENLVVFSNRNKKIVKIILIFIGHVL